MFTPLQRVKCLGAWHLIPRPDYRRMKRRKQRPPVGGRAPGWRMHALFVSRPGCSRPRDTLKAASSHRPTGMRCPLGPGFLCIACKGEQFMLVRGMNGRSRSRIKATPLFPSPLADPGMPPHTTAVFKTVKIFGNLHGSSCLI
jgi:hypothetical protein